MSYDYKAGKLRLESILSSKEEIVEVKSVPQDESSWTYSNGIESWITSIFIDLRDSKKLFSTKAKFDVAKVIRSFTSEIIEIFNGSNLVREIGIRGDCVFGVFSTPSTQSVNEVLGLCEWANTYIKMLNNLLVKYKIDTIKAGIGISCSKDLIVKTGRKGTGIYDRVWIGKALAEADRLSKITSKVETSFETKMPIAMCKTVYNSIKEFGKNSELYTKHRIQDYYAGDVIRLEMNSWIDLGMKP